MYSIKTVEAYIKGEDIEKYTIEELENDPTFMRMIVLATNDKNIYNLCSEKVKLDYEFVKMMIKRFQMDLNFVCQVANYYLENSSNEGQNLELLIIMRGLTNGKEEQEEQFIKYSLKLECFYSFHRIMASEVKKENKCEDKTSFNNIVGMGFFALLEDFGNSELVLNFFAKRFIGEILDTINLEKRLHQHFNNFEELEKKGINNYIIDLLNEFDTCLCNYVLSHSYLLEILRKKFFAIKKKWIYFDLRNRELKIDWIIYYIQDYVKKHEEDFRFPDCFIIGYIAANLNIPELKEYASDMDMEYMKILNIKELNHLNIMLKTIRKIINNNVFEPPEEEQSSSKKKLK